MSAARVLGNNVTLLLRDNRISKEKFAGALGYSVPEVQKLCDARLFTTDEDVEDIAEYFGVTRDELYMDRGDAVYTGDGFMHCMGKFHDPEDREKILDFFDMYCDMEEALTD